MNILFITGFCAHYRVKTFEMLHQKSTVEFLFFSDGGEKYWDKRHGVQLGDFRGKYLEGVRIFGTRITPSLISRLLLTTDNLIIKCIGGRFALPITYLLTRFRKKRFVLWTNLWYHPDTLFHRLSRPFTDWIYQHSDAIVACGTHVEEYLVGKGVDRMRIFISEQAVDNTLFSHCATPTEIGGLKKELPTDGCKTVLYVGRFDAIKGLDYLIKGFAGVTIANTRLVLVGEGRERRRIELIVREMGLEKRVIFRNYVSNKQLPQYYALANVLVLPSITIHGVKEVWGLVINEAMNQGCPVVATESVGAVAGGLVKDGLTGYVVPERDAHAITLAIEKILTDDALESKMRSAAIEQISQWTYERQVQGFVDAIEFVSHGIS